MAAHELHGELFEGEQAMNLGLRRVGQNIAFTVVVVDGITGARAHLSERAARQAWFHLGELLGYGEYMREQVEERARDLAREWIRMDDNDRRELHELREQLAVGRGTRVDG